MLQSPKRPDYILLGVCIALMILGILILSSVSSSVSQQKFGTSFYFLRHQLIFGFLPGLIAGFVAFKTELSFLKKLAPFFLFISLILMVIVLFPKITGQTKATVRWLDLGPVSFQPAEFLKISLIFYWASWLSSKTEKTKNPNFSLLIFLIVMSIIGLFFVLQPDVSTFGVIFLVSLIIYFLAETPLWHTLLISLIAIAALFLIIQLAPYRVERFVVFFNPEIDPMGLGYQIKQALITIGSGGIFGTGPGLSKQRFGFLPESMSDSIFAIFAEETGLTGSLILVSLFLLFFWRVYKIIKSSKDNFSQFLALGIGAWIILQAFINIGSMIGILPLTGIPIPFISYGGSALISALIGVGLLLNISKQRGG